MRKSKQANTIKYPSARLTGMTGFMEYAPQPGWPPSKVDINLLKRIGVGKGKEGLVVYTLRFLGMIDEAGMPTPEFDKLKKDYQSTLKRLIQEKYAELLSVIPPNLANQKRLVSFFCSSGAPEETAEYQAKLFVWLCQQAGIDLPGVENRFHRARFDKKKKRRGDTK